MDHRNDPPNPGDIVLPMEPLIIHHSELFDGHITRKAVVSGVTRDLHRLTIRLIESDPMVQQHAEVEVPQETYVAVEVGERVLIRCYKHPDGSWTPTPPTLF